MEFKLRVLFYILVMSTICTVFSLVLPNYIHDYIGHIKDYLNPGRVCKICREGWFYGQLKLFHIGLAL